MHCLSIMHASQVATARRLAINLASDLGGNEADTGKVALLATEVATNLVRHATDGQLLMQCVPDSCGLDLLALDKGPGMRSVPECLRDGYSTAGSAGTGLGAITRLATSWDIYSVYGQGTALFIRILFPTVSTDGHRLPSMNSWKRETHGHALQPHLDMGGVCVPMPGEEVCGDAWTVMQQTDRSLIVIADGLGHGAFAAEVAQEAVRVVHLRPNESPAVLLKYMHEALRGTRGAAVAIAEVHLARQEITFAGIGNIGGNLVNADKSYFLLSQSGIVGYQMRTIRPLIYPWSENALLLMYSDGLTSRSSLQPYPGLSLRHPSLIAGVLYRDYSRGRDDVSVVVAKVRGIM